MVSATSSASVPDSGQSFDERSFEARTRFRAGALSFEDALEQVARFPLTREQLAQVLDNVADDAPGAAVPLSAHDAQLLDAAEFTERPGALTSATVARDIQMHRLVGESLTVNEAAERAGVSTARIRQRLAARTLWAYKWGARRLLPPAQFTPDGIVADIELVVSRLRPDAHPLEVQSLLTVPQPTLSQGDREVSIVTWLMSGPQDEAAIRRVTDIVDAATWGAS